MMSRGAMLSVALVAAAGGLLFSLPAGAQAPRFPRRCRVIHSARHAPQVFIDSITFTGDSSLPNLSQQQLELLLRQRALDGGSGWPSRVRRAVHDAWQDEGYFQAVVSVEHSLVSAGPSVRHVTLSVHVDPGPQFRAYVIRMSDVNPGHSLVFTRQKLRDRIPLHPGQILNAAKVRQGMRALEWLYASKGYIDFTVTPAFQLDTKLDRVNLNFFLDQGTQYRVAKLQILGLDPDLQPILRAKLAPGKIFDGRSLADFYKTEKDSLLPGLSPADDVIRRNRKKGTVDLILDFRACPEGESRIPAAGF